MTENRGGKRAGAGRKPTGTLSSRQVKQMLKTAKRWAKEQGKSIDDILMYMIYNGKTTDGARLSAIKLYKDFTIAKLIEGGEIDKVLGPSIYLPEQRPVLKVVDK